jgi:Tfp pilus assembly protein PilV
MLSSSPQSSVRDEAGFSLIEVLVAVLLLMVGLAAMGQLLATSTLLQANARIRTNGTHLLQAKVEELAKRNFATDPQVQVGGSLTADVANFNDVPANGIRRRWQVQAGPGGNAGLRRLTVRVISTGARNQQRDLTTVIRQW